MQRRNVVQSGIIFLVFTFNFSVFSFQFSVFTFQFSVFSFQFSVFRFQFSVFTFPFSVFSLLFEDEEYCGDKASKADEVVPAQSLILHYQQYDNGKDRE